ncbi:hypothetical protein TNCV_4602381 [Trichonephila clavipes]|nr:hypothetical protein TNCV_4602381 [Trichonephila clavipes]
MTPALGNPSPNNRTTPTGGVFSSRQISSASLPYMVGLWWYWARTRNKARHEPIYITLGYRGQNPGEGTVVCKCIVPVCEP